MTRMPAIARRRKFGYAMWGMVCLVISLVGFWPSYAAPLAAGTYRSPSAMMTWHVLSTMLWLGLIISQSLLVQFGRVDVHRMLGPFGVLVAVGGCSPGSSSRSM